MVKYEVVDTTAGDITLLETKEFDDENQYIRCAVFCTQTTSCNGFVVEGKKCKMSSIVWKRKHGAQENTIQVHINKKYVPTYKILEEMIYDKRYHAKYALDHLKNDVCYSGSVGGEYWQGPKDSKSAKFKFEASITMYITEVVLKNNHENSQNM